MKDAKVWLRVMHAGDVPLREGRAVRIGSREIAIFNLGDRFLAVENRCPHKQGPLGEGIVCGTTVVCPLHGWKLSLETGNSQHPANASGCVQTFPARVERGTVLVQIQINPVDGDKPGLASVPVFCAAQSGVAPAANSAASAD